MVFRNKRILITGITGFVGSYLARYLLDQGAQVHGLVRQRADTVLAKNLLERGIAHEVRLIHGDLRDLYSIASALDASKPDIVFHLASQSFVQRSFINPTEVIETNTVGTVNLLEAIRMKNYDPKVIFAGSSEEYGLVVVSEEQLKALTQRYGPIAPTPLRIPELPISEENPLRPVSPYAVSKVHGDYLMRNYRHCYGMKTVVSRAFNHEGAGRGPVFVTSVVANQVVRLKYGEVNRLTIGYVGAFRDWSHVQDIVEGYCLLAEKGESGQIYNQGSQRTNSVLTYILLCLEEMGDTVEAIETLSGGKRVENPTRADNSEVYGSQFEKTRVDGMLLRHELDYTIEDEGLNVYTDKGKVLIQFDQGRFRPADVPILLSDTSRIRELGFVIKHGLRDIIMDQLDYYLDAKKREALP